MVFKTLNVNAMSIIQSIISCLRGYRSGDYRTGKLTKIKFGTSLFKSSSKSCQHLPDPLFQLLVYLAQQGVQTRDMFRRPGNSVQIKKIIQLMADGVNIEWHNYNIYTVANVVKKYFISLPGGLFGTKFEMLLLSGDSLSDDERRATFLSILHQLPVANQELTILIFGILFRMVSHAVNEYALEMKNENDHGGTTKTECTESILAEAIAKSVAGSIFHSCTDCPENVEKTAFILSGLILDFPSFDEEFVDFYYRSTLVSYEGQCSDFYKYSQSRNSVEYSNYMRDLVYKDIHQYSNIPNKNTDFHGRAAPLPIVTITNPCGYEDRLSIDHSPTMKQYILNDVDGYSLSSEYDRVEEKQLQLMRRRSDWFLNSGSCNNVNSSSALSYDHYDESNDDDLMLLSPDRQLQYQIVATSEPDVMQSFPTWRRDHNSMTTSNYSHYLTVPNQYHIGSIHSSELSSCGHDSRSSFLDEVYSDF